MAVERDTLRDWHRLFGLLLTDFFTDSPFVVEVERDLSAQQQLLDVVILRRRRGRLHVRLPDGLEGLAAHNLVTFKSHHEALDGWAIKELIGHYVAYRKLVSLSPSELLPEDQFRLYAICARFPHNLSGQVPWQRQQSGVYDCPWGTDVVRVIVAGELPREAHNAPLHLFSASPGLVGFGRSAYRQRSEHTSQLLRQLFETIQGEGLTMPYTMEDFERDYYMKHFARLTPEQKDEVLRSIPLEEKQKALRSMPAAEKREVLASMPPEERREILRSMPPEEKREVLRSMPPEEKREVLRSMPPEEKREVLRSMPPEELLGALSAEQIREYLDRLTAGSPAAPRKPRRKK